LPIYKKLTEDELALLEIIRHPVWCGEFLHEIEGAEEEIDWEYSEYQKEFMCDFNPYVSMCCGRSVGKTVAIMDKLVWYCLNTFWKDSIVYTVPNKVHLEPVFMRITGWFRKHPFLKYFTGRTGINSQSFTIKLNNSAVVDCRIAGQSGTGSNVVGLHVPIIFLDEAGFYPWGTWIELLPTLNTWQDGFQMYVSGVPTGMREKNVLFFADQRDDKFSKHRISAHRNPRYSEDDEIRNIKQFGGVESEDYTHLVLGEHGAAAYSLFDRARMLLEDYDVFRGTVYGQKIKEDEGYLQRFYSALPRLPKGTTRVAFGIDLGYVDPTVVLVLYQTVDVPKWRIIARITARQVPYPTQEIFFDKLDSIYHPELIGMDEGSSGKAVIQHLMADPSYRHKDYKNRLVPIQFRSMVTIGYDDDGDELEARAKQFGVQLLQTKVNEHEIIFSTKDETIIGELERTTYTRTQSGELTFKTITPHGGTRHGEDHNFAALLCFVLGLYNKEELGLLAGRRIKLYNTRWSM